MQLRLHWLRRSETKSLFKLSYRLNGQKGKKIMTTSEHEIITCACCGCVLENDYPDGSYQIANGDYVCEDCRDREYVYCEECDELVHIDDVEEVDGRTVCTDCLENSDKYFQCSDCGEWHREANRWGIRNYYETTDGRTICQGCCDNNYYLCYDCGDAVYYSDAEEIEDEWFCPDCARRQRGRIHEYGYKPDPEFKTIHDIFFDRYDSDNLYFGVELEVDDGDNRRDCAEELTAKSEDIYCKTDGSLHEGIEIVTHPCTLDYHREGLPWGELTRIAADYNFESESTSTCGLHVHVGVQQLGNSEEERKAVKSKLVMLFDRHWDNLVVFSRREESELDEWSERPDFDYGENEEETLENAFNTKSRGRYQAVNLTNSHTVEFRLFKGTLNSRKILASIELVSAFCHYAMNHPVDDVMKSKWSDILGNSDYPELTWYLDRYRLDGEGQCDPKEVAYKKVERIEVGDTVEVTNILFSEDEWLRGRRGTVVVIDGNLVGIDFHQYDWHFHRLWLASEQQARLPMETGYWLPKRRLTVIEKGEKKECA